MTAYNQESIKKLLNDALQEANAVAQQDRFINHPLRLIAKQDPISYADTKIHNQLLGQSDFTKQPNHPQLLNDSVFEVRLTYLKKTAAQQLTSNPVQFNDFFKLVNTSMINDPVHRQQIYQEVLAPVFTKDFFKSQLQKIWETPAAVYGDIKNDPMMRGDKIADWIVKNTKNIPPEVANTALDVIKESMPLLLSSNADYVQNNYRGKRFYTALSQLVESADAMGGKRAEEFAKILIQQNASSGILNRLTVTQMGIASINRSIAEAVIQGNSGLSIALANELGQQNQSNKREQVVLQLAEGTKHMHQKTVDMMHQSFLKNGELIFLDQFTSAHPAEKQKAIEFFRSKKPKLANELDALAFNVGEHGKTNAQLVLNLQKLKLNDQQPTKDEKYLLTELQKSDNDPLVVAAVQQSVQLRQSSLLGLNIDWQKASLSSTLPQIGFVAAAEGNAAVTRYANKMMDTIVKHRFNEAVNRLMINGDADVKHATQYFSNIKKMSVAMGLPKDVQANLDQSAAKWQDALKKSIQEGASSEIKQQIAKNAKQELFKIVEEEGKKGAADVMNRATPLNARLPLGQTVRGVAAGAYAFAALAELDAAITGKGFVPFDVAKFGIYSMAAGVSASELAVGLAGKSLADNAKWVAFSRAMGWVSIVPNALNATTEFAKGDWQKGSLSTVMVGAGGAMMFLTGPGALACAGVMLLAAAAKYGIDYYRQRQEAHQYDYDRNDTIREALKVFFSDEQLKSILQTTNHGVSPIVAWKQLAEMKHIPSEQVIPFLQKQTPEQLASIVKLAHQAIDDGYDEKSGKIDAKKLQVLDKNMQILGLELKVSSVATAASQQPSNQASVNESFVKPQPSLNSLSTNTQSINAPQLFSKESIVHTVKAGEYLLGIAKQYRIPNYHDHQMAAAIYHKNPGAFTNHIPSKLHINSKLEIPTAQDIGKISLNTARDILFKVDSSTSYTVQNNDSLLKIALKNQPQVGQYLQTAAAFYLKNKTVFIDGDPSRLPAGVTLKIPSKEEINQIDVSRAREIVMPQIEKLKTQLESPKQTSDELSNFPTTVPIQSTLLKQNDLSGSVLNNVTNNPDFQSGSRTLVTSP